MTRAKILEGENLKTGDQEPDLLVQLIKDNRVPKDLSSVNSIEVNIKEANSNPDSPPISDDTTGRVEKVSSSDGKVRYKWTSSDTETAATFVGEFVVTDSAGEQSTYPNDGYFKVFVEESIA